MCLLIGLHVDGHFPNHLVFGKHPHFPIASNNLLLTLENKTNSNTINSARQNFIKIKATSKLKLALKHHTRTSFDVS